MRGPKPEPAALKLLKGNRGKRAINKLEPKYEEGVPPKPENMDEYASAKWGEIIKGMKDARTLTVMDGGVIEAACSCYSQWRQADDFLKKKKSECYTTKRVGGGTMRRPYPEVAVRARARREFVSYCAELGITTVSRARVKSIPNKETSGLAQFFNKKR